MEGDIRPVPQHHKRRQWGAYLCQRAKQVRPCILAFMCRPREAADPIPIQSLVIDITPSQSHTNRQLPTSLPFTDYRMKHTEEKLIT